MNSLAFQLSALILAASVGIGATAWAARRPLAPEPAPVAQEPTVTDALGVRDDSNATRTWARRAPFRRTRQTSSVRYDAPALAALLTTPTTPIPPRPTLWLRGLVWGHAPAAIIEGAPGTDGPRLVRVGDSVGPLRVRSISATHVVVAGLDTTWRLVLSRDIP